MTAAPVRQRPTWLTPDDCDLDEFRAVVEVETDAADYPYADRVERGVLFYGEALDVATPERRRAVQAELAHALNPALLHGAGTNRTTDVRRMANLLQVSSAFGRAMGTVDTERVVAALYPTLKARKAAGAPEQDLRNVVAAAAEGYAFPTNLDRDKPVASLNPESQAQLVWRALQNDWDQETFVAELAAQTERRRSSLAR